MPSKADFDATVAVNKAAYAGSGECSQINNQFEGFVSDVMHMSGEYEYYTVNYPQYSKMDNQLAGPLHTGYYYSRSRQLEYVVNGTRHYIEGHHISLGRVSADSNAGETDIINFNKSGHVGYEADGTNVVNSYEIGDYLHLDDLTHEFMPDPTFSNVAGNWRSWGGGGNPIYSNIGGALVIDTNLPDTVPQHYGGLITDLYVPADINCELVMVCDTASVPNIAMYDENNNYITSGMLAVGRTSTVLANGRTERRYKLPHGARTFAIYSYAKDGTSATFGTIMTIYSLSIKQTAPANCVVKKPIAAGTNIYSGFNGVFYTPSYISGSPDLARKDLVMLESWKEDISITGMVYPYGNVQYGGHALPGLPTPVAGTFTGADTYSRFGMWQTPGSLVGRGYIWANLTPAQQMIFVSDRRNNVYIDGDVVYQARYRLRAVSGITNNDYIKLDWSNAVVNSGNSVLAGTVDSQMLRLQGARNTIDHAFGNNDGYIASLSWANTKDTNNDKGSFGVGDKCLMVPIMVVQRRNGGIYHPVYNPDGCAMALGTVAGVATALPWHDVTNLNSIAACLDHNNIAAVDPTNAALPATSYAAMLAGTAPVGYEVTGSVLTNKSGRPDGKCSDGIESTDCDDIRMNSKPMGDMNQYLEHKFYKLRTGQLWHAEQSLRFEKVYSGIEITAAPALEAHPDYGRYGSRLNVPTTLLQGSRDNSSLTSEFRPGGYSGGYYGCCVIKGSNGNIMPINSFEHITHTNGSTYLNPGERIPSEGLARFNRLFPVGTIFDVYTTRLRSTKESRDANVQDIIGHPESLSCRKHIPLLGTAQNITAGDMVLANNGHYYVAETTRTGVITTTDVYTNIANWTDLGVDGTIGGYPAEWFTSGIDGCPNISDYEGNPTTLRKFRNGTSGGYIIPLNRNGSSGNHVAAHKVLLTYGGTTTEIPTHINNDLLYTGTSIGCFITYTNNLEINIEGTGAYNTALEEEAIIQVFYKSPARFSNGSHSPANDVRCIGDGFMNNYYDVNYGGNLVSALVDMPVNAIGSLGVGNYGIASSFRISEYSYGVGRDLVGGSNSWPTRLKHPAFTPAGGHFATKIVPTIVAVNRLPKMRLFYKTMVNDTPTMNIDGTPTNTYGDDAMFDPNYVGRTAVKDLNGNWITAGYMDIRLDRFFQDDDT